MKLNQITEQVLKAIDSLGFKQEGAYNLRYNGESFCHGDSAYTRIVKKEDKPGIDIFISGDAKGEEIHIPVVMSESGMKDVVYNDFYIEDSAEVTIAAGCGIHNDGHEDSQHDGIHSFHIGKNANVTYVESHYAQGNGSGSRILNPVTKIEVGENSVFTMDTTQIKGVDSTIRETHVTLGKNARMYVTEKLMTHGVQSAESNMDVRLEGENSSAQIISRSVAQDQSAQMFHPRAIGENLCHAHIQCDSIIMGEAQIRSIPEIDARHLDAQIIHEAAIGRINNEQIIKLQSLGLDEEEAETVIIENFLN